MQCGKYCSTYASLITIFGSNLSSIDRTDHFGLLSRRYHPINPLEVFLLCSTERTGFQPWFFLTEYRVLITISTLIWHLDIMSRGFFFALLVPGWEDLSAQKKIFFFVVVVVVEREWKNKTWTFHNHHESFLMGSRIETDLSVSISWLVPTGPKNALQEVLGVQGTKYGLCNNGPVYVGIEWTVLKRAWCIYRADSFSVIRGVIRWSTRRNIHGFHPPSCGKNRCTYGVVLSIDFMPA